MEATTPWPFCLVHLPETAVICEGQPIDRTSYEEMLAELGYEDVPDKHMKVLREVLPPLSSSD